MYRILIISLLCFSVSGCGVLSFFHPKPLLMPSVCTGESIVREKKVWIEAKTNKIWVNQHVDENGDLVDGHYKYVVVTPGHWVAEGSQDGKE